MAGWGKSTAWNPYDPAYNDQFGSQANAMSNDAKIRASLMQQMQAGQATGNSATDNWTKALANTEGRGDAVMSDPYTQAALDRFKGVLGGADVPYTNQVQAQQLSAQADAGAAALGSQRESLSDQYTALGGSLADPAAQAAIRRMLADNQARNQANLGDMQSRATLTNFGAKNDAASSLAGIRSNQLGMANGQFNQASNLYANQQISDPHQSVGQPVSSSTMPQWSQPIAPPTPAGTQPRPVQPAPVAPRPRPLGDYSNSATPSYRLQGPAAPYSPYGQSTAPADPAYRNGVNTTTGVARGTGFVQLSGQPNTRISYGYNPNLPVY